MGDDAIAPDNIRVVGVIHFSAMLDVMKAYDVADKLVGLAFSGQLPLSQPDGLHAVERYFRSAPDRMSAEERRALYARALGGPGGGASGEPNRVFDGLWLRFVASVSEFARQHGPDARPDPPSGPGSTPAIGQEDVRTRARELALNASRRGQGARQLAIGLKAELAQLLDVLSALEIQTAFGVRGIWRLVERVASLELGGSPSFVPHKTMAEKGSWVFAWLATRSPALWTGGGDALDVAAIASRRRSAEPASTPTDYDLVEACDQWLAVTAIVDPPMEDRVDQIEPREVREAVGTLLSKSTAFAQLSPPAQARVARDTVRVADYLAVIESPDLFEKFVAEVDFPQFVRNLIKGVFEAIVDAAIRQMEAYGDLIAAVAASVDEFRNPRLSDRAVLANLCEAYPPLCEHGTTAAVTTASPAGSPYPLDTYDPAPLDALAGGAWRRLASSRQQTLATMVLMGVNRLAKSGT